MSKGKVKGMVTKGLQIVLLGVVAAMVLPAAGVQGQEEQQTTLGDVISEYGFNWLIGRWEASTDEGQKVMLQYRWALDKNLVVVNFQMDEYALQGMIFFKPLEEEVVQVGVDNRGGHSKATWAPDGDKAVTKYEFTSATGEVRKMAITHAKVDRKTFKAEMFGIDEFGDLSETPWGTLEYKRAPRGQSKKGVGKTKEKIDLSGKWKGEFENEWGEKTAFVAVATKTGKGAYQIKILESFDSWAETYVVLKAKQDASGKCAFEGDSDFWSGTGKGDVSKDRFKGTLKGTESGTFTMSRIP